MKPLINYLKEDLQVKIGDQELIQQAFNHTSYVNEKAHKGSLSNERLEFLGDAVLELVVSQYLYHTYPEQAEGHLTRMRAQLVREPSLAYLARQVSFDQYLKLGKGEAESGGRQRESILSDCFEAFLGAFYIDQGIEAVKSFLTPILLAPHQTILEITSQDYKTKFQELVQQKGSVQIEYRLLKQEGPPHSQVFTAGLFVENQLQAQGKGKSKKEAEMQAAREALNAYDNGGKP